jgi:MFS family permease
LLRERLAFGEEEGGAQSSVAAGSFSSVPRRVRWQIYSVLFFTLAFGYLQIEITGYYPQINIGAGTIGLILGVEGIIMIVAGVPLGILSDRRGRKLMIVLAYFLLSPTILIFGLTTQLQYLMLAAVLGGIAEGASLAGWNAIIADQTNLENRDAAFSLSFIVFAVGTALGTLFPFFFPFLESELVIPVAAIHRDFFLIFGLLAVVTPVMLFFLLRSYTEKAHASSRWRPTRTLLKFSGLNGLIGLGAGFIIPLMATWFYYKFGLPDTYTGPLLAIAGASIGLAAVASPRISRRYGLVRSIVFTQGLSTVFMLTLVFVPNAALAGLVYVVRAALMNMATPLSDSFLMGITPQEQRGLASSVNSIFWRLPNSATTIVGAMILQSGDYSLPLLLATTFYVISVAGFYFVFRKVRPSE